MESLGSWRELFFEALEPGVAGVRLPRRVEVASEFCRRRLRPKKSPILFLGAEVDVLPGCGARCSSADTLGEALLSELSVEDLPLLWRYVRVGEDCPELRDPGLKKAVAGEALDLLVNNARADVGGVAIPFTEVGREGVGVNWFPVDRLLRDEASGDEGVGTARDEWEPFDCWIDSVLFFLGWR